MCSVIAYRFLMYVKRGLIFLLLLIMIKGISSTPKIKISMTRVDPSEAPAIIIAISVVIILSVAMMVDVGVTVGVKVIAPS